VIEGRARRLEPVVGATATVAEGATAGAAQQPKASTVAALHETVPDDTARAGLRVRRAVEDGTATKRDGGAARHAGDSGPGGLKGSGGADVRDFPSKPRSAQELYPDHPQFVGYPPATGSRALRPFQCRWWRVVLAVNFNHFPYQSPSPRRSNEAAPRGAGAADMGNDGNAARAGAKVRSHSRSRGRFRSTYWQTLAVPATLT
jgi:hypothetical protein